MKDLTLTKAERFLLREVDSCPDKVVSWTMLGTCARQLSVRGYGTVMDRLLRRNLLARDAGDVTLTFKGMQALKA